MIYFDLKSDAEYWTICKGKTRNNAFTNLWILVLDYSKQICGVSVIRFALQKTVQVGTRFYQDTGDLFLSCLMLSLHSILILYGLLPGYLSLLSSSASPYFLHPSVRMCPYQRNLACLAFYVRFSTPQSLLMLPLLSLSLSVTPLICLSFAFFVSDTTSHP